LCPTSEKIIGTQNTQIDINWNKFDGDHCSFNSQVVRTLRVTDSFECRKLCTQHITCTHYDFLKRDFECRLFNGFASKLSAIKRPFFSCGILLDKLSDEDFTGLMRWKEYVGSNCEFFAMPRQTRKLTNWLDCSDACTLDFSCTHYNFKNNICSFFHGGVLRSNAREKTFSRCGIIPSKI